MHDYSLLQVLVCYFYLFITISYSHLYLFMGYLIPQCFLDKYQEESSGNGINRNYKNSCPQLKGLILDFENSNDYTNKKQNNNVS